MNEYFRLPFIKTEHLKGVSIFTSPNDRHSLPKAFDIVNPIVSIFYSSVIDILNGIYPPEELKSDSVYENLRVIKKFFHDKDYVKVSTINDRTLNILRVRGWGMLTGHGEGGFGLSQEEAIKIQSDLLDYVVKQLNWGISEYRKRNTLKYRMNDFRAITDSIKLDRDQYVLIMCDGHCFSHYVKKRFKLPFDDTFIRYMNTAAIETAKKIQGFRLAYVQSDEISFLLHRREGSPYFDYRLNKMVSLTASMVSVNFMAEIYKDIARTPASAADLQAMISSINPLVFDGRAFNLPTENDAFAWFLWRQNDCVRNSKQQAAQTYLSHNELMRKDTDEQIKMLLEKEGIDWNTYDNGKKYGRLIYRETEERINDKGEPYIRTIWPIHKVEGQFGDELRKMIKNYE